MKLEIRPIQPTDNKPLQALFTEIVLELNCLESEYLKNPNELIDLYADYTRPKSRYYVITDKITGNVYGGAGYAPLEGEESTCEIQKMYLSAALRGQGFGKKLLDKLTTEAKSLGFEAFYLETMPAMTDAIRLYEKFGFTSIPERLGNTGHNSCSIFMKRSA